MPIPMTKFKTNDEAAHAISDYISKSEQSSLSLRPFNRFSTDYTPWWFFPKGEKWPVYHCSKLFLEKFLYKDSYFLYSGFYVEKGLGSDVPKDVKKNNIMKLNWYWHEFLKNLKEGSYNESVTEILEKSKCSVIVSIDTSEFNKINQPDNEITHPPYDIVRFSIRQSADSLRLLIPAKKILSNFNNCKSSADLAGIFNDLSELSFFWVNFNIGVILRYNSQKDGTWGASDIWHNTLEPWLPWIK